VPPHAERSKSAISNQPQPARPERLLAERQRFRFFFGDEPDRDRTILEDDAIALGLGGGDFRRRDFARPDRSSTTRPRDEADGPHALPLIERGREHVLAGVLLHVIETPGPVDVAAHEGARRDRRRRSHARSVPSSCSRTSSTCTASSRPVSKGWPPDVG
jgi:hypothetical protein